MALFGSSNKRLELDLSASSEEVHGADEDINEEAKNPGHIIESGLIT